MKLQTSNTANCTYFTIKFNFMKNLSSHRSVPCMSQVVNLPGVSVLRNPILGESYNITRSNYPWLNNRRPRYETIMSASYCVSCLFIGSFTTTHKRLVLKYFNINLKKKSPKAVKYICVWFDHPVMLPQVHCTLPILGVPARCCILRRS